MRVVARLDTFVRDIHALGWKFAFAALRQKLTTRPFHLRLWDYDIWCRGGQTDLASFRQTMRESHYRIGVPHFEAQLRARYEALLAQGRRPVIVDAGANVGASCLWFIEQYPQAALVAVEPDAGNAAILRRNMAPLGQVTVLEAAIGPEAGFVMTGDPSLGWAVRTERAPSGIPMVSIAEAASRVENGQLFLVKIDIEGFEGDLFSANVDWLDEVEAVVIEPHDWLLPDQRSSRGFQRELGKRAFAMVLHEGNITYVRDHD
jgi:FkbM family methyltransferase